VADQLKIEIDVQAAKASLESLSKSFTAFQSNATTQVAGVSKVISRLNEQMRSIQAINPAALTSLQTFNQAVANMQAGGLGAVTEAINRLNTTAGSVNTLANSVMTLAGNLQNVRAPTGTEQIASQFQRAGSASRELNQQVAALSKRLNQTNNDIRSIGREVGNTAGYMLNMGVTAGNLARALSDLSQRGTSLSQIFTGLQANFGQFGAIATVVGGAAIAFSGLYSAASSVIQPIIQVGMQFQQFQVAIDAIDKKGAGATTLNALKDVAKRTATDIGSLTQNFVGFRAASEAAGLSSKETIKIFEGISVGLRGMGRDTQSTGRAFTALTQMMSKGTVMSEELKQQLGDSLPGAMQFAAKSIGVTTAELQKMLEQGQVLAKDFLPALSQFLQTQFGDAVAAQARNAAGQIALLSNNVQYLLNAFAQGGGGGVLSGFAQGLAAINTALDNNVIRAVASVIGDLIGVMEAAIGGVIGGFIQGFTGIGQVILGLLGYIPGLSDAIGKLAEWFRQSQVVMTAVSLAAQALGAALGALALKYAFVQAKALVAAVAEGGLTTALAARIPVLGAVTAATGANAAVQTTAAGATGIFAVAMNAAAGAVARLNLALRANPFIAIGTAIGVVGYAIYELVGGVDGISAAWNKMTGAAGSAAKETDTVTVALEKYLGVTKESAAKIQEQADAMFTFQGAQAAAKATTDELKIQMQALNEQQKKDKLALDEAKIARDEQVKALQREKQAREQSLKSFQDEMKSYDASARSRKEAGNAMRDTAALQGILKDKVTETANAITAANAAYQQAENTTKLYALALKESEQSIQSQMNSIKMWGVVLSDSSQKAAEQIVSFGKTKEEAAKVAFAIDQVTKSNQQLAAEQLKQADQQRMYGDFLKQQVELGKQNVDSQIAQAMAAGRSREEAEKLAAVQIGALGTMKTTLGKTVEYEAALRTLAVARMQNVSIEEAAGKVAQEMANHYGVQLDKTKLMAGATEQLTKEVSKNSDSLGKADEASKNLGETSKTTAEKIKEASDASSAAKDNIAKVGDAMSKTSGVFDAVKTSLSSIAGSFGSSGEGADRLALALPPMEAGLTQVNAALAPLNESMAPFVESMNKLSIDATTLGAQIAPIAQSFTAISQAIVVAAPPMQTFSAALATIPQSAPGIDTARVALESMVTMLTSAAPVIAQATELMNNLGATGETVKIGFKTAQDASDSLIGKLSELMSKLDDVISKMNDLKAAAEAALAAAQAASSASSSSSSGQREGGYSEENLYKSASIIGSKMLKNAPAYAEGTANTSRQLSKLPGGGIPSILHPNEAVIPLSKGRKVPVDLKLDPIVISSSSDMDTKPFEQIAQGLNKLNVTFTRGFDVVSSSSSQVTTDLTSRNFTVNVNGDQTQSVPQAFTGPVNGFVGSFGNPADLSMNGVGSGGSRSNSNTQNSSTSGGDTSGPTNVTFNIDINLGNVQDVDGFKRSEDQIIRSLGEKLRRAQRRVQ